MADNMQEERAMVENKDSDSIFLKTPNSEKQFLAVLIALVCLAVIVTHWPAVSAKALCFDDHLYFVDNPLVRDPGLKSAWRFLSEVLNPSSVGGYYQPLTMISLMLDYWLVGPTDDISQFHITSLLMHAFNTGLIIVLLYMLFRKIWIAAAAGLLFGVHPLTVETIPWVGERKTLLAALFVYWSLIFYLYYTGNQKKKFYLIALAFYILALMSKPTSTPLPAMLLLLDYWPLRRFKLSCVWEKIPFFVIGSISAVISYISQSATAGVVTPEKFSIMRIPYVFCHNIIFYPMKMLWPVNLTPHNPFPSPLNLSHPMILIGVIGTALLITALIISLRWTRGAVTGWLIFFIMVLPTMQVVQFSNVIASDKFAYLPSFGFLIALAAVADWLINTIQNKYSLIIKIIFLAILAIVVSGEIFATRRYLTHWRDSLGLWTYVVQQTPDEVIPRSKLGAVLAEMGEIEKGLEHLEAGLKIDPYDPTIRIRLGVTYADMGKYEEARREFEFVLKRSPKDIEALYDIARCLNLEGRQEEAIEYYKRVLKIKPIHADTYIALALIYTDNKQFDRAIDLYLQGLNYNPRHGGLLGGLGSLYLQLGRVDEAIEKLTLAAKLKVDSAILANLGAALVAKGDSFSAIKYFEKAIEIDPKNAKAYYNLGNAYMSLNRLEKAADEYKKAVETDPNYAMAYGNLAVALAQMNRLFDAIHNFTRAAELEPNNSELIYNLAAALARTGEVDKGIQYMERVIELSPNDIWARIELAQMLLQKGDVEQAKNEYEQVLKIDPDNKEAQLGLQNINKH